MSKIYDFLKECGCFFVLTLNGNFPAGRPFGAVMEVEDDLFIATHDGNQVYSQLRQNGKMQILAKKEQSREWLRINGIATECTDLGLKQRMMDRCPSLQKHYPSADCTHYLLFRIQVQSAEFH